MSTQKGFFLMKLGVLVVMRKDDIAEKIKEVSEFGFNSCQICCWDQSLMTDEMAEIINNACAEYNVKISTFWCGWEGPAVWNFYDGPHTLGLVPKEYRFARVKNLCNGSDFAKKLGVDKVATHVGFIPEQPTSEEFSSLVCALRYVANYYKANGQYFLFETGQETPVTLLRTIEAIGLDNLGINLDPANLILYGKANPVDALDVFGKYVMDVHAKDGVYPTDGQSLGKEVLVGTGKVNFPEFVKKLREVGYDATLTIEREISGEQQRKDIAVTKEYLEKLI